jgi:hypothetical protein
MWCWRRIEQISWLDRVKNEEALHRGKEERNMVRAVRRWNANWIGHILHRKIEGNIEVVGRRGRRGKQLLYDRKGKERIM